LGCLDNVACLDQRVRREAEATLAYLAQKEIQESKEKGDSRVLQDHQGLLVKLAALETQDLLALLEKQEPLE
jgi:hypothetical protein